jgi:sec-independent protein translocase protein TatB
MFEVGFSEICMVALVALLVIGPEKLPKIARMAGFWVAKSRRIVTSVKQEIHEEFQAEELRQSLKNQRGINEFKQLLDDATNDLHSFQNTVNQQAEELKSAQQPTGRDEPR